MNIPALQNLRLLNLKQNCLSGPLPLLTLPRLEALDISKNSLTDLSGMSSQSYSHLQIIFAVGNKLRELPILNCPKLEVFSFDYNEIASL